MLKTALDPPNGAPRLDGVRRDDGIVNGLKESLARSVFGDTGFFSDRVRASLGRGDKTR